MDSRAKLLLLFLVISCIIANASSSVTLNSIVNEVKDKMQSANEPAKAIGKNNQLCMLCEEFTSQALYYLSENKTQTEIISSLHKACLKMHSFSQQCLLLVDRYASLFFLEIAVTSPEQFCEKMKLCNDFAVVHIPNREDTCSICHHVVEEVLAKLKDPDTQLDILEALLKGCNKVENYVQQCKKLVLEYAPIILINAEKFLETTDICLLLRACKTNQELATESALATA